MFLSFSVYTPTRASAMTYYKHKNKLKTSIIYIIFVKFLTISLELLHFYTKCAESPKFAQI